MARKPNDSINRIVKEDHESYARVLIVCEGQTEKAYFEVIREKLNLSHVNIKVTLSYGSASISIAKDTAIKVDDNPYEYDYIFCVFDRDNDKNFKRSSQMIQNIKNAIHARSWPCFEYWILLHFTYKRPLFTGKGEKSQSQECITEINNCIKKIVKTKSKHIPKYKKADKTIFKKFIDKARMKTAIKNAVLSCKDAVNTSTLATRTDANNTSTEVYKVLKCLMNIKKK